MARPRHEVTKVTASQRAGAFKRARRAVREGTKGEAPKGCPTDNVVSPPPMCGVGPGEAKAPRTGGLTTKCNKQYASSR
eukprot:scaffold285665_cov17-Tisochrysis_lutea.AAC.3